MANIPFKSITFPGLPNKYTVPEISNDLMTAGKAADAKATGDALSALEDQFSEETDKLKADLEDNVNDLNAALTNELLNGNAFDILPLCKKISRSANNVTFTWNSDGSSCTVSTSGTASARTVDTIFDKATSFPVGMKAGGGYRLKYSSTNVYFLITCYKNGTIENYGSVF
jgi:molybdopterin converting factor small subunit